jgi:hypothetical protein
MSAEHKAMMHRWFEEVWNKGRSEAIDELLAADGVVHGLGPADLRGPAEFKQFHAAYRNAFPDVRIQLDQVIAEVTSSSASGAARAPIRAMGSAFRRRGGRSASAA